MRTLTLCLLIAALASCTTTSGDPYWHRPGASLPQLAHEAGRCYEAAVKEDAPAALAVAHGSMPLLPRTEPPPALWKRPPRDVALERFDEQLRYERCMRALGWRPVKVSSPAL
jgi:hypothetical protein